MVQIRVEFNTFNKWAPVKQIYGPLKEKLFNLYFMFYMVSLLKKPRVAVRKKLKRTIVVLKSPFHYKTPKHHIQYSYYGVYVSISTRAEYGPTVRKVLSSFFVQNKPHRIQIRSTYVLKLPALI